MSALTDSYSLWLKPSKGPFLTKLEQEIARQSQEHGGAPLFEPHVTLLGNIQGSADDVHAKTQRLAGKLKAFRINLLDVSLGSSFHQCVYLLVAKDAAIMQAGALARQEFTMGGNYMPHLSLLYAELGPEATYLAHQAAVQRLYGEGSNYTTLLTDTGFTAEAITLWYTPSEDRSLASWKQLAEFPLQT